MSSTVQVKKKWIVTISDQGKSWGPLLSKGHSMQEAVHRALRLVVKRVGHDLTLAATVKVEEKYKSKFVVVR